MFNMKQINSFFDKKELIRQPLTQTFCLGTVALTVDIY